MMNNPNSQRAMNKDVVYRKEAYQIIGACFEVSEDTACGFFEPVYQECMKIELDTQGISAMAQPQLKLSDRGPELKQRYIPDFICYAKAILEPKSVSKLCDEHRAQLHNYLNATRYRLGLLVNFGHQPNREWERIVLDTARKPS